MDINKRLGTRDTLLALLLALLQGFPLGETAPNPSPLVGSNWGNPRRYVHLQTSTDLNNFYLEIRLDGTVCKSTVRSSYSKCVGCCCCCCISGLFFCFCFLQLKVCPLTFFVFNFLIFRCYSFESWNQGAHRHPWCQKQPLPVYGCGGQTVQLSKSLSQYHTDYSLIVTIY